MSARWYRALLYLLLPRGFRREYGELMLEAFRSMVRDRTCSLLRTWLFAVRDLVMTAGREWRTELKSIAWSALARRSLMSLVGLARVGMVLTAGLAALAGAVGWFLLFMGPQWGVVEDLGWGRNGLGYRPWGIVATSLLLAAGLSVWWLRERRTSGRLRLVGLGTLVLTAVLMAVQAPLPLGGVSFDSSGSQPAQGVAVYLLPFAVSLLALEWGLRGTDGRSRLRTAMRAAPGMAMCVLAVALLFPAQAAWFDRWDFVFRYAFIFPALALALRAGYDLLGGPRIEVRLRPRQARATT